MGKPALRDLDNRVVRSRTGRVGVAAHASVRN
jgi:hypothetical protein